MERIIKTLRFPKNLIDEIEEVSSEKKINFTEFVTGAVINYLREIRFTEAVSESAGSWDIKKHPELEKSTQHYVRNLRKGRKL